jgi:alkanesulfonate monooxygenase SsuD/methylene tetrahydromethanopterin reductase-like flavin-dependent oxidoreductase (luciferase family)
MLGGAGPKSVAQAARLGDGNLLPAGLTDEEVADTCARIAAHRTRSEHPVLAPLIAATGLGAQDRVAAEVARWMDPADVGIGVAGRATEIAARVRTLAGFGVTSVGIQPTEDEPDLEGFVEFLGREVKPLLDG